jgi:hypothetical protein
VQITSVPAVAVVSRQQFVQQVAVAVLDVDEVEPGLPGEHGGVHVVLGEPVEFVVGQHRCGVDADAAVEQRVRVGRPRQRRSVGSRPAPRVRELQTAHLRRVEFLTQLRKVADGALVDDQLVRVGPPVGTHCRRLAPHEPAAARSETPPPPPYEIGRAAVGGSVPALHRQHGETVRSRQGAGVPSRIVIGLASAPAGSTSSSMGISMPSSAQC